MYMPGDCLHEDMLQIYMEK